MDSLGKRLQAERKRLGLGQEEFAGLAGLTRTAQSLYERDQRHPDTAYLQAIAAAGVDIQYVVTGMRASPAVALSAEEAALLDNYRNADDQGRESLNNVSKALAEVKAKETSRDKKRG
jgi:transcriptional regulator with XRE-family HTH domain